MGKIDSAYYAHSSRLDLSEETRVNATNDEADKWRKENEATTGELYCRVPWDEFLTPSKLRRTSSRRYSTSLLLSTTPGNRRS